MFIVFCHSRHLNIPILLGGVRSFSGKSDKYILMCRVGERYFTVTGMYINIQYDWGKIIYHTLAQVTLGKVNIFTVLDYISQVCPQRLVFNQAALSSRFEINF